MVYDFGELGAVPEKNWTRATVYSPAVPIARTWLVIRLCGIQFKNDNAMAFVNDLEQPGPPFWWSEEK